MENLLSPSANTAAFLGGEGDAWFERNLERIEKGVESPEWEKLLFGIIPAKSSGDTSGQFLIEIGCSSGHRLARISKLLQRPAIGIDPSKKAIDYATRAHGAQAEFRVGIAQKMPIEASSAEVLFFGFCLYLVPESELESVMEEVARVLIPRGYIAVLDFDSDKSNRRLYSHHPAVQSYRRDMVMLFSERYRLVAKLPISIRDGTEQIGLEPNPENRIAAWLFSA